MNVMYGLFAIIMLIIALTSMLLSLLLIPLVSGYFFCRLVLKVLGLHSGSPEQVRNEIRLAAAVGALLVLDFVLMLLGSIFGEGI